MHIETSADARRSRRHAVGDDRAGHASGGHGYLAAAANRVSMWWSGNRRPSALTADADSGAGLQGGIEDDVPRSDGDANLAPSEGCTTSDLGLSVKLPLGYCAPLGYLLNDAPGSPMSPPRGPVGGGAFIIARRGTVYVTPGP